MSGAHWDFIQWVMWLGGWYVLGASLTALFLIFTRRNR